MQIPKTVCWLGVGPRNGAESSLANSRGSVKPDSFQFSSVFSFQGFGSGRNSRWLPEVRPLLSLISPNSLNFSRLWTLQTLRGGPKPLLSTSGEIRALLRCRTSFQLVSASRCCTFVRPDGAPTEPGTTLPELRQGRTWPRRSLRLSA
jgi:hypothetical protein